MIGYSLSGSVFANSKSNTPLTCCSTSSFRVFPFFVPLLAPLLAFISLSTFSTSSKAFLKSFCPPCRSDPRSSMSSSARKRKRRSLSDSANRRMGWPLSRRRRTVSSFEMLNCNSDGAGELLVKSPEGEAKPDGRGEPDADLEGTYPPFHVQLKRLQTQTNSEEIHTFILAAFLIASASSLSFSLCSFSSRSLSSRSSFNFSISPLRMYLVCRGDVTGSS